jgi:hypothetical protein
MSLQIFLHLHCPKFVGKHPKQVAEFLRLYLPHLNESRVNKVPAHNYCVVELPGIEQAAVLWNLRREWRFEDAAIFVKQWAPQKPGTTWATSPVLRNAALGHELACKKT